MKNNISRKGIRIRFLAGLVALEFSLLYEFEEKLYSILLLSLAMYYLTCCVFKFSPFYSLISLNTTRKIIKPNF